MPSPFPGMDPYIESPVQWPDFHVTFINALRETIADALPEPYFARIQEDTVLLEPEPYGFRVQPDVLIGRDPGEGVEPQSQPSSTATIERTALANLIALDPHVEYFIKIIRLPAAEAITVIEVLSPTNKQGGGRGLYTNKRGRLLQGEGVNLVELDLLRAGRRLQLAGPFPRGDYHALVSRADRRPTCEIMSWSVRSPLPIVPIPLRAPDADASADLAKAFAVAYERGRYARHIRYSDPPPPPAFSKEDADWVARIARAAPTR